MRLLNKNEQKTLKNYFKKVLNTNKELEAQSYLHKVLVEVEKDKITFKYTNKVFLMQYSLEILKSECAGKQFFIHKDLIKDLAKTSINWIETTHDSIAIILTNAQKITINKEKTIIQKTIDSQDVIDTPNDDYPDLNSIKGYLDITPNHYTIELSVDYLTALLYGKTVKLQIDLSREYSPIVVTTDNGMNSLIMPRKLLDDDKARNQKIQKRLKTADTPVVPTN
jgi:hypothetical protein